MGEFVVIDMEVELYVNGMEVQDISSQLPAWGIG
jgi:hypothetical protein